ncbi:MAG: hypothetical protein ACK5HL_03945 [Bacilli bacterium]
MDYVPKKLIVYISIYICVFSFIIINRPISAEKPITFSSENVNLNKQLDVETFIQEYESESIEICSNSSIKTYMDYKAITNTKSKQYKYIKNNMIVDSTTGLLKHKENKDIIGIALGSYFGPIGSMYEFTLSSGKVLKVVKVEAKSDAHTYNGCYHRVDNSVLEFVIDTRKFKNYKGGKILGNFGLYDEYAGNIVNIRKISI